MKTFKMFLNEMATAFSSATTLRAMDDNYNKDLFNGELPHIPKIDWFKARALSSKSLHKGGHYRYQIEKVNGDMDNLKVHPIELTINEDLVGSIELCNGIMLHEMLHVKCAMDVVSYRTYRAENVSGGHHSKFMKLREELNNTEYLKSRNIVIPISETIDYEYSDAIKDHPIFVIIASPIGDKSKGHFSAYKSERVARQNIDFFKMAQKDVPLDIEMYHTNNMMAKTKIPLVSKLSRTFKRISFPYPNHPEISDMLDDIRTNGKKIDL